MLERMDKFFEARLSGYDAHMLQDIEGASEFYPFTASLLPAQAGAAVLDLGCGTGLELEEYFRRNPAAKVTGIDLSRGMLDALRGKFPEKDLTLFCGSYFDEPFGAAAFDAAVSVESLHHFTKEEKLPLYRKLYDALKSGGYFILTDYFAPTEADEIRFRDELIRLKAEQGITDGAFYHYDTPLTVEHEIQALREAGFDSVRSLMSWGNTVILCAEKR